MTATTTTETRLETRAIHAKLRPTEPPWSEEERAAFDRLYQHQGKFVGFAMARIPAHDAEDVAAALWERLMTRWPALYAEASSRARATRSEKERDLSELLAHVDQTLLKLAWTTLRRLLTDYYRKSGRRADLAPVASLDQEESLLDVAAPDADRGNPAQDIEAQDTMARILSHCSSVQRAVVLLLSLDMDAAEVREELKARGVADFASRSSARQAVSRLFAVLVREEPDLDIAGRKLRHAPASR